MKVKTTYLAPTDTQGMRIRVTTESLRRTFPYPHRASDAHKACVRKVFGAYARIEHTGSHARGEFWEVS